MASTSVKTRQSCLSHRSYIILWGDKTRIKTWCEDTEAWHWALSYQHLPGEVLHHTAHDSSVHRHLLAIGVGSTTPAHTTPKKTPKTSGEGYMYVQHVLLHDTPRLFVLLQFYFCGKDFFRKKNFCGKAWLIYIAAVPVRSVRLIPLRTAPHLIPLTLFNQTKRRPWLLSKKRRPWLVRRRCCCCYFSNHT